MKKAGVSILISCIALVFTACKKEYAMDTVKPIVTPDMKIELGKNLFFDKGLSNPIGQSCSSCHSPETAFSDFNHNAISPGAVDGLFGNRNAPSIIYSMYTPAPLHYSVDDSAYMGGQFLDGRVNTLTDQAQKPFLNVLEMNNVNPEMVVSKVQSASYFSLYQQIYGNVDDIATAFNNIADALSAYESSDQFSNRFTSKYDYYLKGQATLTAQELSGMQLFIDTLKGQCANCHLVTPDPVSGKILFTDFTYTNDGVPKNPNNPFYTVSSAFNPAGVNYIDVGLGGFLNNHDYDGMFKVSTLRNVAVSAPYFHNGSFNSLEDVVHFYNTRDVPNSGFPASEITSTVDTAETGNLKLTTQEEKDIVAFLKTLTDGYK
ncbi:MAG TPA: cytochrome c peroxidase [Bacteroidia bacterium]|nr:cytochrome c peroxidase [Bacteroidia bacterium]